MNARTKTRILLAASALALTMCVAPRPAPAVSAAEIDRNARRALDDLYAGTPGARTLGEQAKGILVFPSIVKGGFIWGGQYGEGALLKGGKTVGYYNSVAGSWGLQAGIQSFAYVLFFMDQASLDYLDRSDGWEIGAGPSIVIVDQGMAKALGTTASHSGVFAFIFSQKGLMAGLGIQGSKITRINKD